MHHFRTTHRFRTTRDPGESLLPKIEAETKDGLLSALVSHWSRTKPTEDYDEGLEVYQRVFRQ